MRAASSAQLAGSSAVRVAKTSANDRPAGDPWRVHRGSDHQSTPQGWRVSWDSSAVPTAIVHRRAVECWARQKVGRRRGRRQLRIAERAKRRDELNGVDHEMARPRCRLFHQQGPTRQPRIGPHGIGGGEHGGAEQLIPDGQREAKVDVLTSIQFVVDPVKVRTDEDPPEGSETEAGVRVGEGDDPPVEGEDGDRERTVREQHQAGEQRQEIGDVDEGMGAKDGEHVHVLLGMVKLVEPPEHSNTVIGEMHGPVATVHRHDDDGDGDPAGHRVHARQDDPRKEPANGFGERERQRGHQRKHQCRVDHRDQEIMAVAAGQEGPLLGRP